MPTRCRRHRRTGHGPIRRRVVLGDVEGRDVVQGEDVAPASAGPVLHGDHSTPPSARTGSTVCSQHAEDAVGAAPRRRDAFESGSRRTTSAAWTSTPVARRDSNRGFRNTGLPDAPVAAFATPGAVEKGRRRVEGLDDPGPITHATNAPVRPVSATDSWRRARCPRQPRAVGGSVVGRSGCPADQEDQRPERGPSRREHHVPPDPRRRRVQRDQRTDTLAVRPGLGGRRRVHVGVFAHHDRSYPQVRASYDSARRANRRTLLGAEVGADAEPFVEATHVEQGIGLEDRRELDEAAPDRRRFQPGRFVAAR